MGDQRSISGYLVFRFPTHVRLSGWFGSAEFCLETAGGKGAALPDPAGLSNSSLEGNTRRAIDSHEGNKIDEKALKALIHAAVALNASRAAPRQGTRA